METKPKRSRAKKVDEVVAIIEDTLGDSLAYNEFTQQVVLTKEPKKRSGGENTEVEAVVLSHREKMKAVDAQAAATRQRVLEEAIEKGYGPMPRTSYRWMGRRTKGLPFSRMVFVSANPGVPGMRGSIVVMHPTKKSGLEMLTATDSILETFMPSLPGSLAAVMLGAN